MPNFFTRAALVALLAALACAPLPAAKTAFPGLFSPGHTLCLGAEGTDVVCPSIVPVDPVVRGTAVDRGVSAGTTATALMPANPARRGFAVQNQSAASDCYISGQAGATADYHSLKIPAGSYYESPGTHVGTGAISIVCTAAATPVYAREW